MFINLSDVISEQHKPIDIIFPYELASFKDAFREYTITSVDPVRIRVDHVKKKELMIYVDTKLQVQIPCDRCLNEVDETIEIHGFKHVNLDVPNVDLKVDSSYSGSGSHDAYSSGEDEYDESIFVNGYNLDVDKLLYNEILTGWPAKILCDENCLGICSVCGQNQNEGACNCEDTGLDPRMSVIRDLFQNSKEV